MINHETNITRQEPSCDWLHRHRIQRTPDPPRQQQPRTWLLRAQMGCDSGFQPPRHWPRKPPHNTSLIM